jgi:hypothetical protein
MLAPCGDPSDKPGSACPAPSQVLWSEPGASTSAQRTLVHTLLVDRGVPFPEALRRLEHEKVRARLQKHLTMHKRCRRRPDETWVPCVASRDTSNRPPARESGSAWVPGTCVGAFIAGAWRRQRLQAQPASDVWVAHGAARHPEAGAQERLQPRAAKHRWAQGTGNWYSYLVMAQAICLRLCMSKLACRLDICTCLALCRDGAASADQEKAKAQPSTFKAIFRNTQPSSLVTSLPSQFTQLSP